jgi:hypothetical protein
VEIAKSTLLTRGALRADSTDCLIDVCCCVFSVTPL